ncbi:MAG: glycosyltransferase [Gammaproteobacteria bacterium]|nr:glycosyltransferase [Gammaproteobacteria bacterium]
MNPLISIIIPVYNGATTLEACLYSTIHAMDRDCELIVVDDGSTDGSAEIAQRFPCRLIQLRHNWGAAYTRNLGAYKSFGKILFFTDADCLLDKTALSLVRQKMQQADERLVIGGSYTPRPYDDHFFSRFQSIFVHYSENKHATAPDYIATHAMAIRASTFQQVGGFNEKMGPILEDVEFSHRLRQAGMVLQMLPELQVQHIFNYSLRDSWKNAIRKTRYWIQYSLKNHDLLVDSGTASIELKTNVISYYLTCLLLLMIAAGMPFVLPVLVLMLAGNLYISRGLLEAFYIHSSSRLTGLMAMAYYLLVYPLPVGLGVLVALINTLRQPLSHWKTD